jgi:hypothetical protein
VILSLSVNISLYECLTFVCLCIGRPCSTWGMRLCALVMTACAVYYVAVTLVKEPRHMRLDTGLRPAQGVRDYCNLGGRSDAETEGSPDIVLVESGCQWQ